MKYFVGIDIGGTTIKHGLVDENGTILQKGSVKTGIVGSEILENIRKIVEQYQEEQPITSIGVSAPGIVQQNGFMTTGGAIRDFYGINLKEEIEKLTGTTTTIENDANAAAYAEKWKGNAQGLHNYLCMVVGTGIGGGIIINDQIYRGGHGMAGELGMMSVMDRHFEEDIERDTMSFTAATVGGLLRFYNEHHNGEKLEDARVIYDLASKQDYLALESLDFFYTALARGIMNLIVALDPEKILIGGGISANEQFINGLNQKIAELKQINNDLKDLTFPPVEAAELRNDAGIIGATYRALQEANVE